MSYRVYDEFDKTMVSKKENGDLIVSAQMPEDEWLIGYLLSFQSQIVSKEISVRYGILFLTFTVSNALSNIFLEIKT